MRIDFTNCQFSNIKYSGSEKKIGVIFANSPWMLKFRKPSIYGEMTNDISEYIGSKIFSLLGFEAQEVLLGIYQNEKVVACKDFMYGKSFTPFNDVGESSVDDDKTKYLYSYNDIQTLIAKNKKIDDKNAAIKLFWRTYIVDALIANRDRHGKNWGFIKKNNVYYPAPIFDNGDSLFAAFNDEEELLMTVQNEKEMMAYIYETPRSVVKNDNGLNDYYSVISSKQYKECNAAILEMTPLIKTKLKDIIALVEKTDLGDIKKTFLKKVLLLRFELIIEKTYKELIGNERNN